MYIILLTFLEIVFKLISDFMACKFNQLCYCCSKYFYQVCGNLFNYGQLKASQPHCCKLGFVPSQDSQEGDPRPRVPPCFVSGRAYLLPRCILRDHRASCRNVYQRHARSPDITRFEANYTECSDFHKFTWIGK